MRSERLDFVLLAGACEPGHGSPSPPAVRFRVRLEPSRRGRGEVVGEVVVARAASHDEVLGRCLSLLRRTRRSEVGFLALGGCLAGDLASAAALRCETGLAVFHGGALAVATLLDVGLTLVRWVGSDPARAGALVLTGPADRELGEAAVRHLAPRVARLGVSGLPRPRFRALADEVLSSSGLALSEAGPGERADSERLDLLVRAVRLGPPSDGPDRTGAGLLAGPGALRGGRPVVVDLGAPGATAKPVGRDAALPVVGVVFSAPMRWSGRPEPGLPLGLVSAPLAEACVWAVRERPGPTGGRPGDPFGAMGELQRGAAREGFRPAGLVLGSRPSLTLVRAAHIIGVTFQGRGYAEEGRPDQRPRCGPTLDCRSARE